jgi:hypothetical protein
MSDPTAERAFQDEIIAHLKADGWLIGVSSGYDRERALYPEDVVGYFKDTQPEAWKRIASNHPQDPEAALLRKVTEQLEKVDPNASTAEMRKYGTLGVLRHAFKDRGVTIKLCQFKPDHGLNPDTLAAYGANRLRVVPELIYSPEQPSRDPGGGAPQGADGFAPFVDRQPRLHPPHLDPQGQGPRLEGRHPHRHASPQGPRHGLRPLLMLPNFKLLPDYSRLEINGESWLFVGGAVSINRIEREAGKTWWIEEDMVLREDLAQPADVLVTHAGPSWLSPPPNPLVEDYIRSEEAVGCQSLRQELADEQLRHDRLFELVKPRHWYLVFRALPSTGRPSARGMRHQTTRTGGWSAPCSGQYEWLGGRLILASVIVALSKCSEKDRSSR